MVQTITCLQSEMKVCAFSARPAYRPPPGRCSRAPARGSLPAGRIGQWYSSTNGPMLRMPPKKAC